MFPERVGFHKAGWPDRSGRGFREKQRGVNMVNGMNRFGRRNMRSMGNSMTRGNFVRGLGVAAAGVGAAAMGLGGTARANGGPKTIYVEMYPVGNDSTGDGTQAAPYATIQKAVDEAQGGDYLNGIPGDTILIGPGNFKGAIVPYQDMSVFPPGPVTKKENLTICGSGQGVTIIDKPVIVSTAMIGGFAIPYGLLLTNDKQIFDSDPQKQNTHGMANGTVIRDISIDCSGWTTAPIVNTAMPITVMLRNDGVAVRKVHIYNNGPYGAWHGMYFLRGNNDCEVSNCTVDNCRFGIWFASWYFPITGNKILNNTLINNSSYGVWLNSPSTGNSINETVIQGNIFEGIGRDGIVLENSISGDITGNDLSGFTSKESQAFVDVRCNVNTFNQNKYGPLQLHYWGTEDGISSSHELYHTLMTLGALVIHGYNNSSTNDDFRRCNDFNACFGWNVPLANSYYPDVGPEHYHVGCVYLYNESYDNLIRGAEGTNQWLGPQNLPPGTDFCYQAMDATCDPGPCLNTIFLKKVCDNTFTSGILKEVKLRNAIRQLDMDSEGDGFE